MKVMKRAYKPMDSILASSDKRQLLIWMLEQGCFIYTIDDNHIQYETSVIPASKHHSDKQVINCPYRGKYAVNLGDMGVNFYDPRDFHERFQVIEE